MTERKKGSDFLESIANKGRRKKLRIELSKSRAILRRYGLDVADFSDDELVATVQALNACALKADVDAPTYLIMHRGMYAEHGARKFVAWMQMIASSDKPLPSVKQMAEAKLAEIGIQLEDPAAAGHLPARKEVAISEEEEEIAELLSNLKHQVSRSTM